MPIEAKGQRCNRPRSPPLHLTTPDPLVRAFSGGAAVDAHDFY